MTKARTAQFGANRRTMRTEARATDSQEHGPIINDQLVLNQQRDTFRVFGQGVSPWQTVLHGNRKGLSTSFPVS